MQALIRTPDRVALEVVDVYESFIWTERYFTCGDFELYLPVNPASLETLREDHYLELTDSDVTMIVEGRTIVSDIEKGDYLTVTGRSLESILERRIAWGQTILDGNLQSEIQRLLTENAIAPSITERRINNLIFVQSTDPAVTGLTVQAQYYGEDLFAIISSLCEQNNIGFKMRFNAQNLIEFSLYSGKDRSYEQLTNPYIEFKPDFENILNSNYAESKRELKTVAYVSGEGEGSEKKFTIVERSGGGGSGLHRREIFIDNPGVSSHTEEGEMPIEEYMEQLSQRGKELLNERDVVRTFEGQIDTSRLYMYGRDFFIGDILQLTNEYGIESRVRVVELVRSQSSAGFEVYPTFVAVEQ